MNTSGKSSSSARQRCSALIDSTVLLISFVNIFLNFHKLHEPRYKKIYLYRLETFFELKKFPGDINYIFTSYNCKLKEKLGLLSCCVLCKSAFQLVLKTWGENLGF